ncbi:sensor domain-containing diguanylate cyclase [Klebsiella pneumoniae]|uniref:sensor domain-containing diguanylate cyclase n=3 Tax=Klebsiella pneumoniae TaxID=573 RepID=UPI002542EF14|nr:sensor domain-containing diguanylate cyclase [Klebsiella pneumoniae]WII50498.1 sensor domain-containing diguanylate cyclase [Klebsiella pneumoniae]
MRIKKPHLRPIVITLSVGGIFLTSIFMIVVIMFYQHENIEKDLLDANSSYAMKMSDVMSSYIEMAQGELEYGAKKIESTTDVEYLKNEADRLRLQSGMFNSVIVVSNGAVVLATSPESLDLVGVHLNSSVSKLAIEGKKAFISQPYKSVAGNLIILLSHPIYDKSGNYIGYIGGSIYLKKQSLFSDVLSRHFFNDDTEITIVSDDGNVIFNKDNSVVGRPMVMPDDLKSKLASSERGDGTFFSSGHKYLLGYAHMKNTDWNVFVYSHADNVTTILINYAKNVLVLLVVIIVVFSVVSYFIASQISIPLENLAISTNAKDIESSLTYIKGINAWYAEADRLKKALLTNVKVMMKRVNTLNEVAVKDPLTGVNNRLGFSNKTKDYTQGSGASVIAIDVDFFKKINDFFGHGVGDEVLISLAHVINSCCRSEDIVCRFGGEEFVIFLPNTSVVTAERIAERIRSVIESTVFTNDLRVTISAGVATQTAPLSGIDFLLKNADDALYQAKGEGRNKVIVYSAI